MFPTDLEELIALMLVAGGPPVIPARGNWPLHAALREMSEAAARDGVRELAALVLLRPSADVGVRADGADRALFRLVQRGVFVPEGTGRDAALRVDDEACVPWRRTFMRLEGQAARQIQRAGTRWRTLADTSAKNRATATTSSAPTVPSGTPNRLKVLPGRVSNASSRRLDPLRTRLATQ